MTTEIWLTVTGEQRDSDGRADRNAVQCRALYEKRGQAHIFTYRETDPESGAVTESEMVFADNACRILRKGAVTTTMQFSPGREYECMYGTAYGEIPMKIDTKRIAMKQIGQNFHARVSYTLSFVGGDPMDCAVTIKAEPIDT